MRVFRLDCTAIVQRLRRAAESLVAERDEVLGIWLFGSLARGKAVPGSDADTLIVVRDGAGPFLERSRSLAPYFEGSGVGCDVLVYTESESERLTEESSFVKSAVRDGLQLAVREHTSRSL